MIDEIGTSDGGLSESEREKLRKELAKRAKEKATESGSPIARAGVAAAEGYASGGPVGALLAFAGSGISESVTQAERQDRENAANPNATGRPYGNRSDSDLATLRQTYSIGKPGPQDPPDRSIARQILDQNLAMVEREIAGRADGRFRQSIRGTLATETVLRMYVNLEVSGPANPTRPVPVRAVSGLLRVAYDDAVEAAKMVLLSKRDPAAFGSILPEFLGRSSGRTAILRESQATYRPGDPNISYSHLVPGMPDMLDLVIPGQPGGNDTARPGLLEWYSIREAVEVWRIMRINAGALMAAVRDAVSRIEEQGGSVGTENDNAAPAVLSLGGLGALLLLSGK